MRNLCVILLTMFFISGCNERKEFEYGRIDLKTGFTEKSYFLLTDVADDIEYVFLETNDSCLMADIYKVLYDPPYYFIKDYRGYSIFIFDETGKYANTISSLGQGPQEYICIDDFTVHNNLLYILDRDQKKILKYGIDGKCIGVFKINEYATGINVNDDDEILIAIGNHDLITFEGGIIPERFDPTVKYKREGFVFLEYDRDFNLKRKFKNMKYSGNEINTSSFSFYKHRDTLVYWEYNIFDTVYTILPNGETKSRFILDPGNIPSSLVRKREDIGKIFPDQFDLGRLVETDDYLFIYGSYNRYATQLLYNKKDNRIRGIEEVFMNDIDGGISFWPSWKLSDNKVGTSFFPDKIKKYIGREIADLKKGIDFYDTYRPKTDYDLEKHKMLLDQLKKTDDMSNPVLMIVTIKSSTQ